MFRMRPEVNDSTRGHLSRADLPDSPHAGVACDRYEPAIADTVPTLNGASDGMTSTHILSSSPPHRTNTVLCAAVARRLPQTRWRAGAVIYSAWRREVCHYRAS